MWSASDVRYRFLHDTLCSPSRSLLFHDRRRIHRMAQPTSTKTAPLGAAVLRKQREGLPFGVVLWKESHISFILYMVPMSAINAGVKFIGVIKTWCEEILFVGGMSEMHHQQSWLRGRIFTGTHLRKNPFNFVFPTKLPQKIDLHLRRYAQGSTGSRYRAAGLCPSCPFPCRSPCSEKSDNGAHSLRNQLASGWNNRKFPWWGAR